MAPLFFQCSVTFPVAKVSCFTEVSITLACPFKAISFSICIPFTTSSLPAYARFSAQISTDFFFFTDIGLFSVYLKKLKSVEIWAPKLCVRWRTSDSEAVWYLKLVTATGFVDDYNTHYLISAMSYFSNICTLYRFKGANGTGSKNLFFFFEEGAILFFRPPVVSLREFRVVSKNPRQAGPRRVKFPSNLFDQTGISANPG